jgi:hypothetical protein
MWRKSCFSFIIEIACFSNALELMTKIREAKREWERGREIEERGLPAAKSKGEEREKPGEGAGGEKFLSSTSSLNFFGILFLVSF